MAWAIFKLDEVQLTQGVPKVWASSEHGRRHFCAVCGTGLFCTNDVVFDGLIDGQSATLDEPDAIIAPQAQVQIAERIGWLKAGLQSYAFERYPG